MAADDRSDTAIHFIFLSYANSFRNFGRTTGRFGMNLMAGMLGRQHIGLLARAAYAGPSAGGRFVEAWTATQFDPVSH